MSDRPLEIRAGPRPDPRDILQETIDIRGLVDDEHRVLAAAAMVIRQGLDNLADAMTQKDDEG